MKKESELYLLVGLTFLISGFLVFGGAKEMNSTRINLAVNYYNLSLSETDQGDRLSLIVRSNTLVPSEEKELEIARIYLDAGDYSKAERYLSVASSQKGYVNLAQALLEKGDIKAADIVIGKIADNEKRAEILLQKEITNGQTDSYTDLYGKELYFSKFLHSLNTRDYQGYIPEGFLGNKFNEIIKTKKTATQAELEFSSYLMENNQGNLADFMINRIIAEKSGLADAHLLRARSEYLAKNYDGALNEVNKAISFRPEDISLYQKATDVANAASNPELAAYYQQKIFYLQKINK